jgi:oligogalacturonide lyase
VARGDSFAAERIDRIDEVTRINVRQVTSWPTQSLHLHYETPTFTPDSERMLVLTRRTVHRKSPWDIITMRSNGDEPTILNDDENGLGAGSTTMTVDGEYALYMDGGTCHRTRLVDASDEEIGHVDGGGPYSYDFGARTADGGYYFAMVPRNGRLSWVRWNLRTGEHDIIVEADLLNHPMADPGSNGIGVGARHLRPDGDYDFQAIEIDGSTLEPKPRRFPMGPHGAAHAFWLGNTGKWQSTQLPPGRAVQIMEPDAEEVEIIAEGPYFWHCGSSLDGKWIVADSNWPDEGLWLINVATKKRERLCYAGASQGNPQWTHLHANLNDDGTMAVFDSDRTGIPQVYVMEIPEEMRVRLRTPDA